MGLVETEVVTQRCEGFSFEYMLEREIGEKGARTTEKIRLGGYEPTFEAAKIRLQEAKKEVKEQC